MFFHYDCALAGEEWYSQGSSHGKHSHGKEPYRQGMSSSSPDCLICSRQHVLRNTSSLPGARMHCLGSAKKFQSPIPSTPRPPPWSTPRRKVTVFGISTALLTVLQLLQDTSKSSQIRPCKQQRAWITSPRCPRSIRWT